MGRWTGGKQTITSYSPFLSQIRLWRLLPRLSTRPSLDKISSRLHHVHIFKWRRRGLIPKFVSFLYTSPGLVGRRRSNLEFGTSLKHGVVLAVKETVDQRRRASQAFHQNLINNHYHFDDDQIIIAQILVISSTYTIAYWNSLTHS